MARYSVTIVIGAFLSSVLVGCSSQTLSAPDSVAAPSELAASPGELAVSPGSRIAASASGNAADHDTVPVHLLPSAVDVPGAWSTLVRNDNGVTGSVHTDQLIKGDAYTMWFVVFNNPGACVGGCGADDLGRQGVNSSVVYATGHVVGGEGNNFSGWLGVGDTDGAVAGPGLLDPRSAEIHLVIRNHGAAIPGLIDEQIHSFNGGCPPNSCANVQAAQHKP
jgi:hypothetical protein